MEPNGVSESADVGKTSKPKSSKQNNNIKRSVVNKQEMDIYKSRLDLLAQDATREQISFPATLSSIDRKLLHTYAHKLGLDSRSVGKGNIFSFFFSSYFSIVSFFSLPATKMVFDDV